MFGLYYSFFSFFFFLCSIFFLYLFPHIYFNAMRGGKLGLGEPFQGSESYHEKMKAGSFRCYNNRIGRHSNYCVIFLSTSSFYLFVSFLFLLIIAFFCPLHDSVAMQMQLAFGSSCTNRQPKTDSSGFLMFFVFRFIFLFQCVIQNSIVYLFVYLRQITL